MGDQPLSEIIGRHDSAPSAAPETGAAPVAPVAAPKAGETPVAASGVESAEPVDPIAGLKSALDKEREARGKFEKDWKNSTREQKRLAQQIAGYERELAALRANVNKPNPEADEIAFYNNPPEQLRNGLREVSEQLRQQIVAERIESSRELAADRYEDFEEVEQAFFEAAKRDASLLEGLSNSRQPALLAYKRGKQVMAASQAGTASEDRVAKLEAEIASLKAGRDGGQTDGGETPVAGVQKPSVPKSNAGLRGSGVGKTTSWAGPTPIENIFGRQRRASK